MSDELERYLDGELEREQLPKELLPEADRWDELLSEARALAQARAPGWLEGRIMLALPERPGTGWRQLGAWLLRPRTVRVRPLSAGLVAAAAAIVLLLLRPTPDATPGAPAAGTTPQVYVQFVYATPSAARVAVAGDFNDWREDTHLLRDPDGDGTWTALVPVRPGLHKYMFVVDGRWVTDPRAERRIDDGFGMQNALLTVSPPLVES